ncbi:hypothetical protein C8F01DRAFT_1367007 [Mycena amicta]|nr:hypothetical protein C8F01DRAFT_1367007 [Mycena amicta]
MAAAPNAPNAAPLATGNASTSPASSNTTSDIVNLKIRYRILDDCQHHFVPDSMSVAGGEALISVSRYEYSFYTVAQLLLALQTDHHTQPCSHCSEAPGQLHVKSAILVLADAESFTDDYGDLKHRHYEAPSTVIFLESWDTLEDQLAGRLISEMTVVLECTFKCVIMPPVDPRSDELGPSDILIKRRRVESTDSGRRALFCIPGAGSLATDPSDLWTHSSSRRFPSYPAYPGHVILDKTEFIPVVVDLWSEKPSLTVAMPPGMGVTTFLDTLTTWLDYNRPPSDFGTLFAPLKIGSLLEARPSFHRYMVMEVDLKDWKFDATSSSVDRRQSLSNFLSQALLNFADKYKSILGSIETLNGQSRMLTRLQNLLKLCVAKHAPPLAVVITHWDAAILSALKSSLTPQQLDFDLPYKTLAVFTEFLERHEHETRLLVAGHLPFGTSKDNIAALPAMHGAFGMTAGQLQSLCSVFLPQFSNRSFDINNALKRRLGHVIPVPPRPLADGVFNMTLALEFVATGAHLNAASEYIVDDAPLLQNILRHCMGMLEDSNLRWGYDVTVAPFAQEAIYSLVDLPNSRPLLRQVLTHLGVLKAKWHRCDPTWALSFSSASVQRQLLSRLPIAPSNLKVSALDIALRGLAEGDPHYLVNMLRVQLEREAVKDLNQFKEVTLQAVFGTIMRGDPVKVHDPMSGKYIDRYLPQHRLITNPDDPDSKSDDRIKRLYPVFTSKKTGRTLSGFGITGVLDALILPRNGLAIAVELKFVNVWGLHRGNISTTDDECNAAFKTNKLAYAASIAVIDLVKNLSIDELREVAYVVRHQVGDSWVTEETFVGNIIDDAIKQLISYLRALLHGRLQPVETYRTKRVKSGEGDRLIGYVICAIAQRVIAIEVELKLKNDQIVEKVENDEGENAEDEEVIVTYTHTNGYRYSPKSDWAKTWDKKVYNQY